MLGAEKRKITPVKMDTLKVMQGTKKITILDCINNEQVEGNDERNRDNNQNNSEKN